MYWAQLAMLFLGDGIWVSFDLMAADVALARFFWTTDELGLRRVSDPAFPDPPTRQSGEQSMREFRARTFDVRCRRFLLALRRKTIPCYIWDGLTSPRYGEEVFGRRPSLWLVYRRAWARKSNFSFLFF